MTYVVTENCINCKHTTCVEVCPTDAFREGPNFLVIDPGSCVDCDLCPSECPIGAIFEEDEVPEDQKHFIKMNAELAQLWPGISIAKAPLLDHEKWDRVEGKLKFLQQ
ncbi:MAG: ferredoxin [Segetibacter sp.]|nr:ferredoxin [Segetibacter sp.]